MITKLSGLLLFLAILFLNLFYWRRVSLSVHEINCWALGFSAGMHEDLS